MKIHSIGILFLCIACGWGCEAATKDDDEFSIHGHVIGLESQVMHLERLTPTKAEPLQDVTLDAEGNFDLVQKGESNVLFQLRADNGRRMLLFPEMDALTLEADADEIEAYQVTGGAKAKMLRDFNLKQYSLYIDYKSAEAQLDGLDRQKDTTAWRALEGVTDRAMVAYRSYLRHYCDTVQLPILRAHAALSITPTGNYNYLNKLSKRIAQEMPGSAFASAIDAAMVTEAEGRVGIVAPAIVGTDIQGKPFDLATLRGKRVMLTFWASYCEFSRAEFVQFKDMQQRFADAGMVLLCFSIDDQEVAWREYLAQAGLDWAIHLRGLGGQKSDEIKQYRVQAIPSTYLINAQGIVETLDMRSDELQAYLQALPPTPNPAVGQ
jgi:peroxiredoxin